MTTKQAKQKIKKAGGSWKVFMKWMSGQTVGLKKIILDLIAVEKLNIKGMLRNHHLAKSIQDASWNIFLHMLDYKLKMLSRQLVLVPAYYTSQKCSKCGELVQKSLSVRTHICPYCGYTADRDENAAKNILQLGQSCQASTHSSS